MKQLILDIVPAPVPTLDNFVVGGNAELFAALCSIGRGQSDEPFIYLWGDDGCGRTHLLRALVSEFAKSGRSALFLSAASATAADLQTESQLVAVDDVDQLNPEAQVALFNLHNWRRATSGALVASGNAPPAQLKLRQDVATRLASGLVYHVRGLSDKEKAAALERHALARGFHLSAEVMEYLLHHARRDLSSLLAVVEALDRYSLETKRAVTVPLLKEILQLPLDLAE